MTRMSDRPWVDRALAEAWDRATPEEKADPRIWGPETRAAAGLTNGSCVVDEGRLNDAMWAACNMRWNGDGPVPSMESASEAAARAVCAYLGVQYQDYLDSLDAEAAAFDERQKP